MKAAAHPGGPRAGLPPPGPAHVAILLATHNGAGTLPDQLSSLKGQSHGDWSLIVSDDGSTDATRAIVRQFARDNPGRRVALLRGPGRGSAQNFLSLLRAARNVPFAAFCDQDDVWLPAKLTRAVRALVPVRGPAIYGSRTIIADAALRPLRLSPHFRRPTGFRNALIQNVAGGNTMVMNRAALDLLQPASRHATGIVSHDWWAYQAVTAAGGAMVYDRRPSLLYRQHGANQIGANDTAAAMLRRLGLIFEGRFARWMDGQIAALEGLRPQMTDEASQALDRLIAARRGSLPRRLSGILRAGLYRQTRRGTLALWLAAASGRL